ncbi:O-antigen ligase family protein [Parasphingorhabdus sp.]|uniref:O-antigen ligase family protein n=1 Tax=Parasphingorhabdus sp. TaxID=2709688 RepID=UPI003264B51F
MSTWVLWLIGGLYIAGPVIAWILAGNVAWRFYLAPGLPEHQKPKKAGWVLWTWVAGMALLLVTLWIGHSNFDLGMVATIKSSIGWAKGWALLAIFILAGAALDIRPAIIYRAICKLGAQTLILLPIFLIAPFAGLPETLYVSPLQIVGGPGPEYFATTLYTIEPGAGVPRWQFFAPWSPAAGMVAMVYVICAIEEKQLKWKLVGISAGLIVALLSQSRLALVALAVVWPMAFAISRVNKPAIWFAAAPVLLGASLFSVNIVQNVAEVQSEFESARADSSRVRAALGRIAVHRWQEEAPWFGHGVVERGPHLVEYMMIGSHHSWYGLLFVKGIIGLLALAIPMALSLFLLAQKACRYPEARVGLSLLLLLLLYSFGENLEILAYLYWPALILIGNGLRLRFPIIPESDKQSRPAT